MCAKYQAVMQLTMPGQIWFIYPHSDSPKV